MGTIPQQANEFIKLDALIKSYKSLPIAVDDSISKEDYESALKSFLEACRDNGRKWGM